MNYAIYKHFRQHASVNLDALVGTYNDYDQAVTDCHAMLTRREGENAPALAELHRYGVFNQGDYVVRIIERSQVSPLPLGEHDQGEFELLRPAASNVAERGIIYRHQPAAGLAGGHTPSIQSERRDAR